MMELNFFERIRQLVMHYCGGNLKAFAEKVDVKYSTLHRNMKDQRDDLLQKFAAKILHACPLVRQEWLFYGKGEMLLPEHRVEIHRTGEHSPREIPEKMREEDLTTLPVYDTAGSGPAWDKEEAEPIFFIAVPTYYLRPNITPLYIRGRSMEPTILDGAVVGVNREQQDVIHGEIYAVRLPYEGIVVKRLYLDHETERFILKSDNQKEPGEFKDISLSFGDGDAFIYGRIAWVLQTYDGKAPLY